MTAQAIAYTAGIVTSLAFEYVPGLQTWYNELGDKYQRLVMLGVLLLVPSVALAFTCLGWADYFACSEVGVKEALKLYVEAVFANQAVYALVLKKD